MSKIRIILIFFQQIASALKDVDVTAIFDRVEDAVVQADEVSTS